MGRKRLDYKKKSFTISIDERDWERLEGAGINKSQLFQILLTEFFSQIDKYDYEEEEFNLISRLK